MAATVVTITNDMGEMMIKQLVDEAFDSLFSTGSIATTNQGRVSGHGQDSFRVIFNANMALLKTGAQNYATGSLTMATKPVANDTVTIGTTTYKFVATPAASGDVAIGAAVANSQANLLAAINDGDTYNTARTDIAATAWAANVMVVTATAYGTAGNLATTASLQSTDDWGAATMTGGRSVTITTLTDASWQGLIPGINSSLASAKVAVDAI